MPFLTEPEPDRGVPLDVLPGIRRIVARNPSIMTYRGTNTYLIQSESGLTILDPGPDDGQHVQDILDAARDVPIRHIVMTHSHSDHSGAAKALQAATHAPTYMYQPGQISKIIPDVALKNGETIAGMKGLYTPGHADDHLCFAFDLPDGRKILFSGDHVMSWSSSIVSPPDGDMQSYYHSLELLLGRDDLLYLPGHGPLLPNPRDLVAELLSHRKYREATIFAQIKQQPWSVAGLAARLYDKVDPNLRRAAERNVLAHLLKLRTENVIIELAPDLQEEVLKRELAAMEKQAKEQQDDGQLTRESGSAFDWLRRDASRRFALGQAAE